MLRIKYMTMCQCQIRDYIHISFKAIILTSIKNITSSNKMYIIYNNIGKYVIWHKIRINTGKYYRM